MQAIAPLKKWTVLVWSASDNDLYAYQVADLDEAEKVGCSDTFQMVAQLDHRLNPDPTGPRSVQRLELAPDDQPGLRSPVKMDLGEISMSRPEALADFIQWGMKNYPAENYWLVVSDHGEAWKGACQDDGHEDWMSLPDLQKGLELAREATGRKLDLLSFDCCYMGSLEVAHQLRNEAGIMIASEEEMGYMGLPYDRLLQDMDHSPTELARRVVKLASEGPINEIPTSAAIDLSRVGAVSEAVKELGQAVLATSSDLTGAARATQTFWQYKDIYDLTVQIQQRADQDERLRQACQQVQSALDEAVLAEQHAPTHPGAHGLQIELDPDAAERQDGSAYGETAFATETGWAEAARKLTLA